MDIRLSKHVFALSVFTRIIFANFSFHTSVLVYYSLAMCKDGGNLTTRVNIHVDVVRELNVQL